MAGMHQALRAQFVLLCILTGPVLCMHFASQIHLFSAFNIFSITNRKQQKKRKKVIRTIFPDTQFLFVQWSNIDSAKPELLIACNEPD